MGSVGAFLMFSNSHVSQKRKPSLATDDVSVMVRLLGWSDDTVVTPNPRDLQERPQCPSPPPQQKQVTPVVTSVVTPTSSPLPLGAAHSRTLCRVLCIGLKASLVVVIGSSPTLKQASNLPATCCLCGVEFRAFHSQPGASVPRPYHARDISHPKVRNQYPRSPSPFGFLGLGELALGEVPLEVG